LARRETERGSGHEADNDFPRFEWWRVDNDTGMPVPDLNLGQVPTHVLDTRPVPERRIRVINRMHTHVASVANDPAAYTHSGRIEGIAADADVRSATALSPWPMTFGCLSLCGPGRYDEA